jgi:lipoprotein-anchoring transpeptidase ErfK/SrfK
MDRHLSRRAFLKRTGGVLAALTLPPDPKKRLENLLPADDAASRAQASLGRITTSRLNIHAAPDVNSEITGYRTYDDLITLLGTAEGPGLMSHNRAWFKTHGGHAYSSFVQPVARQLNRPLLPSQVSPEEPALLEVTMPYVSAYRRPEAVGRRIYRLYYATTHWAVAVERDEEKNSWYKLHNDRGRGHYYVRAEQLRPIPPEQLTPISPRIVDKRIEIDLTEQQLTAYEGDTAVLVARVSSGAVFNSSDGVNRDFRTPMGTFRVWRKRASRHMEGGTWGIDYFDLPGVPWVSYFTGGIALHGTYWHNDYGRQRSHGCVNLTPEHARWLFLWTEPEVPADEEVLVAEVATGTPVRVFW